LESVTKRTINTSKPVMHLKEGQGGKKLTVPVYISRDKDD